MSHKTLSSILVVLALSAAFSCNGAAQTINFAPLAQSGSGFNNVGSSYSQGGFTFTGATGGWGPDLGAFQLESPNHPRGGGSSTALTAYYADARITMTADIGPFDLVAIDLSQYCAAKSSICSPDSPSSKVTFHGLRDGHEVVSQTFKVPHVAGSPVLSTYKFSGFTNLTSVYVVQGIHDKNSFQFNNVVYRSSQETRSSQDEGSEQTSNSSSCIPAPAGLVAWLPGDGSTKDVVRGQNGVAHGTVAYASGKVKQAFSLDGASYVSESFSQTGPFTVDLWAEASSSNQGQWVSLVSTGLPGHYDPFFQIDFDGSGGYRFTVGGDTRYITTKIGPAETKFQHIAVTYDGSTVTTYLDGQRQHQDKWTSSTLAFEILKIGINRDQNYPFSGLIDEVHVFNRALGPEEIQELFKSGSAGVCHSPSARFNCPNGPAVLLWTNSNTLTVHNGPGGKPAFGLSAPACITQIVTYHWNDGRGATPGEISLQEAPSEGPIVGTFQAQGTSGQNNAPNVNWVADINPPLMVRADNYSVIDSDDSTWSRNLQSSNRGFATVYGICADGSSNCVGAKGAPTSNLAGEWHCTTVPPCGTGPASITRNGKDLVFVNEHGSRSAGKVLNSMNVVAYQWQGGLHGVVSLDGNSILWENKTRWQRGGTRGNSGDDGGNNGGGGGQGNSPSFTACHPGSFEEALLGNPPCAGPPGTPILIQAKRNFREHALLSGVVFKAGPVGAGATSSRNVPPSTVQVIVCRKGASNCRPRSRATVNNGLNLANGDGIHQGSLYQLQAPVDLCSLVGSSGDWLWDVYLLFPNRQQPGRDIGYFQIQCGNGGGN